MRVAVFGASGYTGGELLRLLAMHPAEVAVATSREHAGKPVYTVHWHLKGFYSMKFKHMEEALSEDFDAAFLALPHGVSMKIAPSLLEQGIKVIDLSADYRLKSPEEYRRWYGIEHPHPDLLEKAVYGLPELHREEIRRAELVASPGCNATAAILASAPLVELGADLLIADIKVGSSEAGAKPTKGTHHPERSSTVRPYSPSGHRHSAEAAQELSSLAGRVVRVTLIPHSVSAVRGAFASVHTELEVDESLLWKSFARFYAGEPFIRVLQRGVMPSLNNVVGSNFADIGFSSEPRIPRASGFSAIDNLVKGAAGQAIQAFNIMIGLDERTGLYNPPLHP